MRKRKIRPPKVEMEFTDLNMTAYGGSSILAQTARQFGLLELLAEAVRMKVRNRGASDTETLWAIIACLARGDGALSDLDALRADPVARLLLGPSAPRSTAPRVSLRSPAPARASDPAPAPTLVAGPSAARSHPGAAGFRG